jgi:hypothetical protein
MMTWRKRRRKMMMTRMQWEVETWKMKMTFFCPLRSLVWGLEQASPPVSGMLSLHNIL